MPETGGQEPPQKAQRLDASTISAVADALEKQGHKTLANELQSPTPTQDEIRERQHKDHEAWVREKDTKRDAETTIAPSPSSQKAMRLDTNDVDAVLNALEQAKKFPVPKGEETGQFYYRKAQEILSQRKEQQE